MLGEVFIPTEIVRLVWTVLFAESLTVVVVGETVIPCALVCAVIVTLPENPLRLVSVRRSLPEEPWSMDKSPVLTSIWKLGISGTVTATVAYRTRNVTLELVTRDPMMVMT